MEDATNLILHLAMSLPVAGKTRFERGIDLIEGEARAIKEEFAMILRFSDDLKDGLKPLIQSLSSKTPQQFSPYLHGFVNATNSLRVEPKSSLAFLGKTFYFIKKKLILSTIFVIKIIQTKTSNKVKFLNSNLKNFFNAHLTFTDKLLKFVVKQSTALSTQIQGNGKGTIHAPMGSRSFDQITQSVFKLEQGK